MDKYAVKPFCRYMIALADLTDGIVFHY